MSAREDILAAVRDRVPLVPPLPLVPDFTSGTVDLVAQFAAALERLGGKVVTATPSGIQSWLAEAFPDARSICSATGEVTGNVDPSGFSDWAAPADVDVTVVRSPMGVAETGSILLTETRARGHHGRGAGPASGRSAGPRRHRGEHPRRLPAPRLRALRVRGAVVGPVGVRRHRWRHGASRARGDHSDRSVGAAHRRLRSRVADSSCLVVEIPVSREPLCS